MKKALFLSAGVCLASSAFAATPAISIPGYFGSISNNTSYVLSCADMLGGYCANNPMPANGFIQMLPDPGATEMHGNFLLFAKDGPTKPIQSIPFSYREQPSGQWAFSVKAPNTGVTFTPVLPDTLLLSTSKPNVTQKGIPLGAAISNTQLTNQSQLTIECAQMLGGYCSRNPIPAGKSWRLLPDPGATFVRGHVMVFDPHKPGGYVDNLMMVAEQQAGKWQVMFYDLYGSFGLNNIVANYN